jgi:hypothetical protein
MTWSEIDWNLLGRHRERFLGGEPNPGPYWSSAADLASYDHTFGERIGWKWDAVLDELELRGWRPPGGTVLDWGCGSGVAGRRVIGKFGPQSFGALKVWDHSEAARDFSRQRAEKEFPGLPIGDGEGLLKGSEPIGLLVISHVLNELQPSAIGEIGGLVARASAVIWTEPGSRETSRALGGLRNQWSSDLRIVAPCTHANTCPILEEGNERHWCHFFAPPPSLIFADSNWVKFGQRAGIDLRSLPYSFIALDRAWRGPPEGMSRVIGRPESFKPYVRLLNCDASGLAELSVMRRDCRALCKELEKDKRPLVYEWNKVGLTVTSGASVRTKTA